MKTAIYNLLRKSEKYTKTDMVYLTKGSFWLTGAKVLSALASFISSVAFANLLPEETYGVFRYVLSILVLLSIPTLGGIDTALIRSLAKGKNPNTSHILRTKMIWGSLGSIASLALAGYYFWAGNHVLGMSFSVVAIFVPFMDSFHLYVAILNGKKYFNLLARDEVLTRFTVSLALVGLVFYIKDPVIIVCLFLFLTTVFRGYFYYVHRKEVSTTPEPEDTQTTIRYGIHITTMNILGKVSSQLDKILIFQNVGGTALAAFYLALIPFKQIQNLTNTLSVLALPKLSQTPIPTLKQTLPRKMLIMYMVIVPVIVLYILLAPLFFSIFYPLYPESVLMSQLFILQLLFVPANLLGVSLIAHEYKKKLYINSITYAALRIALLIVLVPLYGVYGAIWAILAIGLINTILMVVLFYKK